LVITTTTALGINYSAFVYTMGAPSGGDDTAAITTGIAACAAHGGPTTILFNSNATYLFSAKLIPNGAAGNSICFKGTNTTLATTTGFNSGFAITWLGNQQGKMDGVSLTCATGTFGNTFVGITGCVYFVNCTIDVHLAAGDGSAGGGGCCNVPAAGTGMVLMNCTFKTGAYAVFGNHTNNVLIDTCTLLCGLDLNSGGPVSLWGGAYVIMRNCPCSLIDPVAFHTEGRLFFGSQSWADCLYIGGNTTTNMQDSSGDTNKGEQICFEQNHESFSGPVVSASPNSLFIAPASINSAWDGNRQMHISGGTGQGQWANVVSTNATTGEIVIDHPWLLQPDATSIVNIFGIVSRAFIYNNTLQVNDTNVTAAVAVQFFGGALDCVVDKTTCSGTTYAYGTWSRFGVSPQLSFPSMWNLYQNGTFTGVKKSALRMYGNDGLLAGETSVFIGNIYRNNSITHVAASATEGVDAQFKGLSCDLNVLDHTTIVNVPTAISENLTGTAATSATALTLYKSNIDLGTATFYGSLTTNGKPTNWTIIQNPAGQLTGFEDVLKFTGLDNWWQLTEAISSGTRADSMPAGTSENPAVINLLDNFTNVSSAAVGPSSTVMAFFDGSGSFGTLPSLSVPNADSAGQLEISRYVGGLGSWTAFARVRYSTLPTGASYCFARANSYFCGADNTHKFKIQTYDHTSPVASVITTTFNNTTIVANQIYSVAWGVDAARNVQFVVVVDSSNNLVRAEASITARATFSFCTGISLGGFSQSGIMSGYMQQAMFSRGPQGAMTDNQILKAHNRGALLPFNANTFAADTSAGPAPFSNVTLVNSSFITTNELGSEGLFWCNCRRLRDWSPSLANVHGDYIWMLTADHPLSTGDGVYMGFSSSPSIKPVSWTQVIPGNATYHSSDGWPDRVSVDVEAGMFCWDAANSKVRCYVHSEIQSGGPSGSGIASGIQETVMYDSSDLVTWTNRGVMIPTFPIPGSGGVSHPYPSVGPPYAVDHTGYATIFAPGELPGLTGWIAYHLANQEVAISRVSTSTDGTSFDASLDYSELDMSGWFPAGFNVMEWWSNMFVVGSKVYGVGRAFVPGGRGMAMAEITQDVNGVWRVPTGKIWQFGNLDTTPYPDLGYGQDVRIYYNSITKTLHIFELFGFYKVDTDNPKELVSYYTLTMN
jgi:hypothetical protein